MNETKVTPPPATKKVKKPVSFMSYLNKINTFIGTHAFILIFLLGGIAIGYSLIHSRSFLNPPEDQKRYNDGIDKVKVSKIDQKILTRLSESKDGGNVKPQFVPKRDNPFTN